MIAKHTPGPWEIAEDDIHGQAVVRGEHTEIATCWHHCVGSLEIEMRANARLIAAAPDMLRALSILLEVYSKPDMRLCCDGQDCTCMGSTSHQEAEHFARAVIAQAKGEAI